MWEYKVVKSIDGFLTESELDQIGKSYWELVNFAIKTGDFYCTFYYIFKRKLS